MSQTLVTKAPSHLRLRQVIAARRVYRSYPLVPQTQTTTRSIGSGNQRPFGTQTLVSTGQLPSRQPLVGESPVVSKLVTTRHTICRWPSVAPYSTMTVEDSLTLAGPRNAKTTIELVHGDLTNMPPEWKVDLLLASAFPNNYQETPSSLIGNLARKRGIHVGRLARDKQEDLRETLECWVSKPLPETSPYHRVMIWEPGFDHNIVETVESIFASIIAMAKDTETLAMPILGAGDRGSNKAEMIEAILYATQKWVKRGLPIKKIYIFMYSYNSHLVQTFRKTKLLLQFPLNNQAGSEELSTSVVTTSKPENPTILLSFASCDQHLADLTAKAIELIDNTIHVEKISAKLDTDDITQKESSQRNLTARASKVIALLTPGYVGDIGCRDHFNECYLCEDGAAILQPIMMEDAGLPNYIQMIQCHDARPHSCVDKLFAALFSIVKSIAPAGDSLLDTDISSTEAMPAEQPTYDVFISYSTRFRAQANAVHEILEHIQPNIRCFFDATELHAGIRWQQRIYQSIDTTDVFFFILTPEFVASSFCREEAAIASLRAREGQIKGVVAIEAIPLEPSAKATLPREVRQALIPNETPFQASNRVAKLLESPGSPSGMLLETANAMHKIKMTEIEQAFQKWEENPTDNFNGSPRICVIGDESDFDEMLVIRNFLNPALTTDESSPAVQIIKEPGGEEVHAIDSAHIIICVMSEQFLKSPFFMNSLNVGLLRNRAEGGCLIPIYTESPRPELMPTYMRLIPAIDGSSFLKSADAASLLHKIAAAAKLSCDGRWKCRTTVVALD